MNEEEKKAINIIKGLGINIYDGKSQVIPGDEATKISTSIYTILNLIEKQQKEIEELKEIEQSHKEENGKLRVELEQEKAKTPETLRKQLELYQDRLYEEKEKNKELLKEYNKKLQIDWEDAISKDKLKELLENEIIDISGFRCIAVEDIENLLEDK